MVNIIACPVGPRRLSPVLAGLLLGFAVTASSPVALAQSAPGSGPSADERINELSSQVQELKALVLKLYARIDQMEQNKAVPAAPGAAAPGQVNAPAVVAATSGTLSEPTGAPAAPAKSATDWLHGATLNALLDTYYAYNANNPIGRVNYLRAYDISSNSFNLSQADIVLESAPDLSADKRTGMRVDLQFGQATEALGGNPANELRPDIWRNIFQAYGTYVFPVGGMPLQLDVGKWASSLGLEGNYTKDQINYSRSFWFAYLPYYHSGLRAALKVNDQLTVNYWVVNGTEQTEAFNNYKDELIGFVWQPASSVAWTMNYYVGQEHPGIVYVQSAGTGYQNLPNQQGALFEPIPDAPDGRLQILDTYATWQATPALSLAAEADSVVERLYSYSIGQHTQGGALYGRYQLTPKVAFAARGEYLEDRGGLFSGIRQYLKEGTLTTEYRASDGFLVRGELRRDASNTSYFLSDALGVLKSHQDTVTVGLVWWVGQKEGTW